MNFFVVALKHKRDGRFLEQRRGKNLQNCVERMRRSELFFENGDQDVDGNRDPNLRLDTVRGGAEEALDPQVLFDPFEEQFDLPAIAINRRYGQRRQEEIVGQENETFVDFFRVITDPA